MPEIKEKHPNWFKMKLERRELLRQLAPETAFNVLFACLEYLETGEKPETLSPIENIVFSAFAPDLDEAWSSYMLRISNGARGGRPKREKSKDSSENHMVSKKPYGTEEETETEPEEETEEEIEKESLSSSPRARAEDRDDDKRETKIMRICSEAVGRIDAAERGMILTACAGMDVADVQRAVNVAKGYGAQSAAYLARTIQTQREKPDREARAASAGQAGRGMLSARSCPKIPSAPADSQKGREKDKP